MSVSIPQLPTSSLPGPPAGDDAASPLEQEEGGDVTTQPPFVGGPRPTMTKLKVNDYFYLPRLSLCFTSSNIFASSHMHGLSVRGAPSKCPLTAEADGLSGCNWLLTIIPVI